MQNLGGGAGGGQALRRVLVAGVPLRGVSALSFAQSFARLSLSLAIALGCAREKQSAQPAFARDDFGDEVRIAVPPSRIVSLNPATTEILFTLGAGGRLIGRTKYDLWPDSARLIPE